MTSTAQARTAPIRVLLHASRMAMSPAELRVCDLFLNDKDAVARNIAEIAAACDVSEPTVTRMAKRIGFSGFHEFRLALSREYSVQPDTAQNSTAIGGQDPISDVIEKTAHIYARVIMETAQLLAPPIVAQVASVLKSAHRVMIYGTGGSFSVAADVSHKLLKLGITALAHGDPDLMAITSAHAAQGDVLIGISHTGRTRSVVEALERGRGQGALTIAMTHDPSSPVAECADILVLTVARPTGLSTSEVSGRIGQLMVFDVIYTALALGDESRAVERVTAEFSKSRLTR